jgi:Tfp pilus assembly protein PilO
MKSTWQNLGRRINDLSLRERLIMAVSLAAALAGVADVLVLSPQFGAQRALVQQLAAEQQRLTVLRAELVAPAPDSPQAGLQRVLAERRAELAALDARIAERQVAGPAAELPALLQRVLQRHDRLTLLRLDTVDASTPDGSATAAAPARRMIELQVAGRYADLSAYAAEIEQQLPGLRWASLRIAAAPEPALMSARLWLAGSGS